MEKKQVKKKILSPAEFKKRLAAGDPEMVKLWHEFVQDLRTSTEALLADPYWKNFYELTEKLSQRENDWFTNAGMDALDETDIETVYTIIKKRMDEALTKPPVIIDHDARQDDPATKNKDKFAIMWIQRDAVRMKGYNMEQFLQENDAPRELTTQVLKLHLKKNGQGWRHRKVWAMVEAKGKMIDF
jgi:hypothetical protein